MSGWFSFHDREALDEIDLLFAVDAFPPPVFNLSGLIRWVPTLELTVHVRARPVAGPIQVRFRTEYISHGLVGEDGDLWDVEGNLVAQSRQLALVPN